MNTQMIDATDNAVAKLASKLRKDSDLIRLFRESDCHSALDNVAGSLACYPALLDTWRKNKRRRDELHTFGEALDLFRSRAESFQKSAQIRLHSPKDHIDLVVASVRGWENPLSESARLDAPDVSFESYLESLRAQIDDALANDVDPRVATPKGRWPTKENTLAVRLIIYYVDNATVPRGDAFSEIACKCFELLVDEQLDKEVLTAMLKEVDPPQPLMQ